MAEIFGEHVDKKKALYMGGALASIVALLWFMKSRNAANTAQPLSAPAAAPGTVSGGTSDALAAAQLNAATQLQIATGNQNVQMAQIQAQRDVAKGAQSTQLGAAALGAAVSPGGQSTLKEIFSAIGKLFTGLFDALGIGPSSSQYPFGKSTGEMTSGLMDPNSPNFWTGGSSEEGAYISPSPFSFTGAPASALEAGGMVDWAGEQTTSAPGTTGTGSTDWFGNAPTVGEPEFIGPI